MSISAQIPVNSYTASGSTTIFPYSFKIIQSADLTVAFNDSVQSSGFTISGVGTASGGEVTFSVAPAAGVVVSIYRDMEYDRQTDYQTNGDLLADTLNSDLDRMEMQIQQVAGISTSGGRGVLAPIGEVGGTITRTDWTDRANKLLSYDNSGNIVLSERDAIVVTAGAGAAPAVIRSSASTVTLPASGEVIVIKTDATSSPVVISPLGGSTIIGDTSYSLTLHNESVHLLFYGSDWTVI